MYGPGAHEVVFSYANLMLARLAVADPELYDVLDCDTGEFIAAALFIDSSDEKVQSR